ncbi:MAG: SDR family oxidoreductase [Lachnospiraceae bacterium]|nr:SDR family oxidoreductase [Lachnospiraceae bacterium]
MKNILVVGASQGIGAKTAEYLSESGYRVVLVSRNTVKLEELVSRLENEAFIFPYDLHNLENIENILKFCKEKDIVLDGMVYCAGINRDMPIRTNDLAVMQEVLAVNYMAFVELLKYFSKKKYSTEGSSIVAISSNATKTVGAGMNTYISSKAALEVAIQVAAKEMIKRKIRVNAILPAGVDTEMLKKVTYLEENKIEGLQPLGLIEPEYISYLVEYLLSDKAKYMTGALIPVSAGAV